MSEKPLDSHLLKEVFRAMGEHFKSDVEVEVLIVGGAALALTGHLPPGRTTLDCDVVEYDPEDAEKAVEAAAAVAGKEFDLPETWFNSDVRWHRDSLPEGWRQRRHSVGAFGKLRIFAADRRDLIVMKLVAGRARDLQDIETLIQEDDVRRIRECLTQLSKISAVAEEVSEAFERLEALEPEQ